MRSLLLGVCTLVTVGACRQPPGADDDTVDDPRPPQEPSSSIPIAPAALGATDFCKLVYEAPLRTLDKACSDGDKATERYKTVKTEVNKRVQTCWALLNLGIQNKRITLPVAAAKRCSEALDKLPWETALNTSIAAVSECRTIAVGLATAGKPCRASYACAPGLFCAGATLDADGVCSKRLASGESCKLPASKLLGEDEAACDVGLFCDALSLASVAVPPGAQVGPSFPWPEPASPFWKPSPPSEPESDQPKIRTGTATVSGRLPPEVIRRIVRANHGRFRVCYQVGLSRDPTLSGRVTVQFTISPSGTVSSVTSTTDLADSSVADCVKRAFYGLSFPQPEGGIVNVTYPLVFSPGGSTPPSADPAEAPSALEPLREVVPTDTCLALRKAGERCRASSECGGKQACVMGECGAPLAAAATCRQTSDCASGLRCVVQPAPPAPEDSDELPPPPKRACAKPHAEGEVCSVDDECSGACVSGKCATFCGG